MSKLANRAPGREMALLATNLKSQRRQFFTNVAGVDDVIALESDLFAVFVHIFGFEFIDDLGVGVFFAAVGRVIPIPYDVEGFSAFNTFCCATWYFSNALVEATNHV